MATATSKVSFDSPPSLLEIPPLANPHALPNHHVRLPDFAPAAHPQTRRASSESQAPGRASPSPRISRRTPVPFLLEAFPAPPSHIPGTPTSLTPGSLLASPSLLASTTGWLSSASASPPVFTNPVSPTSLNVMLPSSPKSVAAALSHSNPPPSSPPTAPLPPVPGPSTVTPDLFATHRTLQTAACSTSPAESYRSQSRAEQRPRLSTDTAESIRGRGRQGSLSSLRNPVYPVGDQSETIPEDPTEGPCPVSPAARLSPPLFGSVAERRSHDRARVDSPDILRSSLSRATATPLLRPVDKSCAEDSIASVDMSDLSALKSDNEGDGDDQGPLPFPRFPPLPRSQPQSPTDLLSSAPSNVRTPRRPGRSAGDSGHVSSMDATLRRGAMSPEIAQIISATPRPNKRSSTSRSRESSSTRDRQDSSRSRRGADAPPVPTSSHVVKTVEKAARPRGGSEAATGEDDANESDSSLDLHTPLPQLMLRHGMLSPNSKLLPQPELDPTRLSIVSSSSFVSNASNLSLKSTASASSKHPKDARDTLQRRVRHRDGKLLKGGIGLTTGLGWSDSEDEDAPSALTRRVSTLVLSRRASSSSIASYRSARSAGSVHPLSRSISHSVLREADELADGDDAEFGYSNRSSLATTRSLPSRSKPVSRVASVRSAGSSLGRYSSTSSTGMRIRAGSASESSIYAASVDNVTSAEGQTGLMPGIREQDDGMTPTRAAFERASLGSMNGSAGADVPHTPSSTASSASLPFPATPESGEDIPQPQSVYNQDKVLPPLPPSARGKYPSTLSLRSQLSALPRPRTPSVASSLSSKSNPGISLGDIKPRTPSTTSTPRQSLAGRPAETAIPAAPRPSLGGIPRPSLTIPKSPFPSQSTISGLPRPATPSSSPSANPGQGYSPRPLRLVSRNPPLPSAPSVNTSSHPSNHVEANQSSGTVLQPGEQSPRTGQVLTYNRNVHDQLKLRALSVNTGPNRTQAPMISSGGAQTLFMPSPSVASGSNSPLSTPVTAQSQSPLPSPGGDGFRPKPRTGTGMIYRNNLSVGSVTTSRIRVPSTVSR